MAQFTPAPSVSSRELIFFSQQVSTLLKGGLPLVKTVGLLANNVENKALGATLRDITQDLSKGTPFHLALKKHPKIFSAIWVALIQAGEISGQMPQAMDLIGGYTETREKIRSKIISALTYPAILFTMSMGVLIFFILKIVPVFAGIFEDFGMKLPLLTQIIIDISMLLTHHSMKLIAVFIAGAVGLKSYFSTAAGKHTRSKLLITVPILGSFVKNVLVERLLTTLSSLLSSGVTILNCLSVMEGLFEDNVLFQAALREVSKEVTAGKPLSGAFKRTRLFPNLVTEMMLMGEESGKLPDILNTLSNFYREQIDQSITRFTALIDPILVVGVGGIIGVIVLSIFVPIFKLSQIKG